MEKVILTQEQADAIDWVMKFSDKSSTVEEHIEYRLEERGWKLEDLKPLNELSTDYLIRALYIGYEVEVDYKVGDWLAYDKTNGGTIVMEIIADTGKVGGIECFILGGGYGKKAKTMVNTHYRLATPEEIAEEKERRFFAWHSRKPWELREGDLLIDKSNGEIAKVRKVKGNRAVVGNYTSFEVMNYIKKYYKVVCFAESRLDVKTNEIF